MLLWKSLQLPRPKGDRNLTPIERVRANVASRHANEVKKMTELFGIITTCTKIFGGNTDLAQLYAILQRQVHETTASTFAAQNIAIDNDVKDYPLWFNKDPTMNQILTPENQDVLYFTTLFFLQSLQLPSSTLQLSQSYLTSINFNNLSKIKKIGSYPRKL